MSGVGRLEAIFIAPTGAAPVQARERVDVQAGRGIVGDRYFNGLGSWQSQGFGDELSLIQAESVEEAAREMGIPLTPRDTRRNLVTRGIALNDLLGKRFRVGRVECIGLRLCPPCSHLEKLLARPGLRRALAGRGGLYARILVDGQIAVGDQVCEVVGQGIKAGSV